MMVRYHGINMHINNQVSLYSIFQQKYYIEASFGVRIEDYSLMIYVAFMHWHKTSKAYVNIHKYLYISDVQYV